jgi:hypothetical protein
MIRPALRLLALIVPLVLAACAARSPQTAAPPETAKVDVVKADVVKADPSYDWHVLVLAPFGILLKESPVPLHEVLFFHDETHGSGDAESKDCFSLDQPPPRFIGKEPDHYLWCFEHDRLTRVEAAVRLPLKDAPQTFARACSIWQKVAAPLLVDDNSCAGRDGSTAFSARLVLTPGETTATVSVVLSGVAGDAAHAP